MIAREDHPAGVRLLTIDRHERRNALDIDHLHALRNEAQAAADDAVRVVVITGAGSAFSAGADLGGVYNDGFRDALYGLLGLLVELPIPVIAAVNGPAIGAGTQLALACDLRVGSDQARFAIPTARNGLAVDGWTVRRLSLLAGGAVARNLLLGAAELNTQDAHRIGLLGRVGDLGTALQWARDIAGMAPLSLRYSKQALRALFEGTADDQAETDALFAACWASNDVIEAQAARREHRVPSFTGK